MLKELFRSLNFDEKESELYLTLIELGQSSATQILKRTSIERRTIYDVLERLIQKGYVSYFEEQGTRIFRPLEPEVIIQQLEEKRQNLQKALPQLKRLEEKHDEVIVDILKGRAGIQAVFADILATNQTHYAFGNISPFLLEFRIDTERFIAALERMKLHEKILYMKDQNLTKIKGGEYRLISEKYVPPNPTIIYGDTIVQFVLTNPIQIVRIKNKQLAKTHKAYFDNFWKYASSSNK